jgi:hypothetical protein
MVRRPTGRRSDRAPLAAVPTPPDTTAATGPAAGATSVLFALLSAASAGGCWCAVVGLPALGAVAAGESGISLERLALVPYPGPEWPAVVAALLDGFDLVVAAPPGRVGADVTSRLSARARQRGSVLLAAGAWAGAELVLTPTGGTWEGLGQGRGRLRRRELTVVAQGRGAATRPRYAQLQLPAADPTPVPRAPLAPVADLPAPAPVADLPAPAPNVLELPSRELDELELDGLEHELDGFEFAEAVAACG